MLLKNVSNLMKPIVSVFFIALSSSIISYAYPIQCNDKTSSRHGTQVCHSNFDDLRDEFNERFFTTFLVTDAPNRLILDTQELWFNRFGQCKTQACIKSQLNQRIDDLNFYISMNQTLTQHYLKFEDGQIASQPVHLKIHQLSKDRIKVEGIAYRNANNRLEAQTIPLLAYTTPDQKNEIIDNERDCKYQFNFQKALLIVNSKQKGCERFNGIYRVYD